jgi:hypothetical protein
MLTRGISKLSPEEQKALDNIFNRYGRELLDKTVPMEHRNMKTILAKKYKDENEINVQFHNIQELFYKHIYACLEPLSIMGYLLIENTQAWGIHGKDNVKAGYVRWYYNITDRWATIQDEEKFDSQMAEFRNHYAANTKDDYLDYLNNFSINIFGRICSYTDYDTVINEVFLLLEMPFYLMATISEPVRARFIFGEVKQEEIDGFKVITMSKELIRTPHWITCLAAEILPGDRIGSLIRQEAMRTIYHSVYNIDYLEQLDCDWDWDWKNNIEDGLLLEIYLLLDRSETELNQFISTLLPKTTIYHEIGHTIGNEKLKIIPEHYGFHDNFTGNNDSIGHAFLELQAEWAPMQGMKMGVISFIVELAKTDPVKAKILYLANLKDYNFQSKHRLLRNIFFALCLFFLKPDRTLDIEGLLEKKDKIYYFFQERLTNMFSKLLSVIRNSEYQFDTIKIDFTTLERRLLLIHQRVRKTIKLEKMNASGTYWENVTGLLEKFSNEGRRKYKMIISREASFCKKWVLNFVTKGSDKKFETLEEYINARAYDLGFISGGRKLMGVFSKERKYNA